MAKRTRTVATQPPGRRAALRRVDLRFPGEPVALFCNRRRRDTAALRAAARPQIPIASRIAAVFEIVAINGKCIEICI